MNAILCAALATLCSSQEPRSEAPPTWSMTADLVESCCCDPICPCIVGSPPTHGRCLGNRLVEITEGHFGDVRLDGVSMVLVFNVGNWSKLLVSDDATEEQVRATRALLDEQSGFLFGEVLETARVPLEVRRTESTIEFSVPTAGAKMEVMTGRDGKPIRVENLNTFRGYVQYLSSEVRHEDENEERAFSFSKSNGFAAHYVAASPEPGAQGKSGATDVPIDDETLVQLIAERAVPLRSIDPTEAETSDLAPLAGYLRGVRVVQIGEASHGDGSAFLVRRRLIRFLHQELEFDVLAFEAGLSDATALDAVLHGESPVGQAVEMRLPHVWASSREAQGVLEYARGTHSGPRPLEITGFDIQNRSAEDLKLAGNRAADLLEQVAPPGSDAPKLEMLRDFTTVMQRFGALDASGRDELVQELASLIALWNSRAEELSSDLDAREHAYLGRCLDSLVQMLNFFRGILEADRGPGAQRRASLTNPRDRAMGENLVWLAQERFAGRKLMTWVATFHAARGLPAVEILGGEQDYTGLTTMGDVVHAGLGDEAYLIAVTSRGGRSGVAKSLTGSEPVDLPQAPAGSLEDLCHRTGLGDLFLDLRGLPADHPLRRPLIGLFLGHMQVRASWPEHLDGVVFLAEMAPASPAD